MKAITVTRGSKWKRKGKIEAKLKRKGKLGRDFSEATVRSVDSDRGQSYRKSSSLNADAHSGEEEGSTIKVSEKEGDYDEEIRLDHDQEEVNSSESSERIPGGGQGC